MEDNLEPVMCFRIEVEKIKEIKNKKNFHSCCRDLEEKIKELEESVQHKARFSSEEADRTLTDSSPDKHRKSRYPTALCLKQKHIVLTSEKRKKKKTIRIQTMEPTIDRKNSYEVFPTRLLFH